MREKPPPLSSGKQSLSYSSVYSSASSSSTSSLTALLQQPNTPSSLVTSPSSEQRNRIRTPTSCSPGSPTRHTPTNTKSLSHRFSLERKLKRKLSSQVIHEFREHLKDYVLAIESALGVALLRQEVLSPSGGTPQELHEQPNSPASWNHLSPLSSPVMYEGTLSEHQKQCKDNLFLSVDLLIQKLKFAEEEISTLQDDNQELKMQLSRTRQREQDLIRRINDIAHLNAGSEQASGSETNDSEEEIELSHVLDSYQSNFADTKRKLKLVEKRLKFYEVLKSQKLKRSEELEKLDFPRELIEKMEDIAMSSDDKDTSAAADLQAPTENMTIIFIDVRGSTALWEAASEQMFQAILLYHSETRRLCKKYKIYESKSDGDGFLCLAADVKSAIMFCVELQEALLNADWPKELLNEYGAEVVRSKDGKKVLFRGLTARCGIHFSVSPKTIVDPVTGRTDVLGSDVNLCARLEQYANPGEVAISNDVYQLVKEELLKEQKNKKLVMVDRGGVKLKGIELPENVRAIVPFSLKERMDLSNEQRADRLTVECESPTDSVAQLEKEQQKLLGEVETMKQRIMSKLRTASEKNIKNARSNFVHNIRELTRDPTAFEIDTIVDALKLYQKAMRKQEKELESCSNKVDELDDSDDERQKNDATAKRIKKLKKKVKRRQNSYSQLTADIHKSTLSQQLKAKADKTLQTELNESRAQVAHLKNEVAILRRALKSKSSGSHRSAEDNVSKSQGSPFATSAPVPMSHSYPTTGHSPTSPNMLGSPPSYQVSTFSSFSYHSTSPSPMTPNGSPPSNDTPLAYRSLSKPTSSASTSASGALFVKLPHIHSFAPTSSNESPAHISKNPLDVVARGRTRKRSQSMVVPSRSPIKERNIGASPLG